MDRRKELVLELADLEDDEEVKQIEHPYDDYFVTSYGRVFSTKLHHGTQFRELELCMDSVGYPKVFFCHNGEPKGFRVHKLVTELFIGPCPEGQEVRHLNGKRDDCRLTNLTYGTRSENHQDKVPHGTHNRGEQHNMVKLTKQDVIDIRKRLAEGEARTVVVEDYPVSYFTIRDIHQRNTWRHLPPVNPE